MEQKSLLGPVKSRFWASVLICAACAAVILVPLAVIDLTQGNFFHYAGDFNGQQISFYRYMNAFVKQGGTYSWQTDLGSGAMNAYSFYLYGSPFFWLSTLLPAAALPWCMVPLLILKFGVSGGGAYLYLARYCKNKDYAVVGACLYGVSGFAIYNIFFNHFVDVVALFPFLLWALDEAVLQKRRGWFALFVAVNLLNNYFFFAGQILFLFIYFMWKVFCGEYRIRWKLFLTLALETALGCGMGFLLVWPALLSLLQNPRTVDLSSGWGFLLYSKVQQYFAIVTSWLLPPDSPYMLSIWSEGIEKWTSLSAWLPLCSLAGVIAYFRAHRGGAAKRIVVTCALFALVPVCNSAFYMLNSSYYARWYYMPVLLLAGMTMAALERPEMDLAGGAATLLKVLPFYLAFALVPVYDTGTETWHLGVLAHPDQYWVVLGVGFAGVLLFWYLAKYQRQHPRFLRRVLAGICAFACAFGLFHISYGKFAQWSNDSDLVEQYLAMERLGSDLPEGFYRLDAYECHDNVGLWNGHSTLQFFNSTVAPSLLEFYPSVGVKRDVRTDPAENLYALRSLLSVKYTVMPAEAESAWLDEKAEGWAFWQELDGFVIYENQNYIPMGFTYDYYLRDHRAEALSESRRAGMMLKAIVLTEEQIAQYGASLTELPTGAENTSDLEIYREDCAARAAHSCDVFVADNYGFSASITLEKENIVFFSVPYEDGFTAAVNGQAADVLKVNNGLLGVYCPAGACEIRVDYQPAGLGLSRRVTLVSLTLFVLYWGGTALYRRRHPLPSAGQAEFSSELEYVAPETGEEPPRPQANG